MPFCEEIPSILVLLVSRIHPLQTLLLLQIFQLLFPRQNFALSGFQMLWEDLLLKQEA